MKAQAKEGNLSLYQYNHSSESSGPNSQELGAIPGLFLVLLNQSEKCNVSRS